MGFELNRLFIFHSLFIYIFFYIQHNNELTKKSKKIH